LEQIVGFIDSLPVKSVYNYYRVKMGSLGYSQTLRIWVVDYGKEFSVVPDILGATIFFSNPNHQDLTFSLYNLQGEKLQTVQTNGDAITMSRYLFQSLIYFFQVRYEQGIL